jgi:hypothetical protein
LTLRFTCVNVAPAGDFLLRNAAFKGHALFACAQAARLFLVEDFAMQWTNDGEKWRAWLVDYSAARASAIERLGDRYLLARPINRRPANGLERRPWSPRETATARR